MDSHSSSIVVTGSGITTSSVKPGTFIDIAHGAAIACKISVRTAVVANIGFLLQMFTYL